MKEISFEIKIPNIKFSDGRKFQLKVAVSFLIAAGAFIAKQNYDFTLVGTLILAYFGISLLWSLSGRVAGSFALFFLTCVPILLSLKYDALAETFAVYAYYFLVITVVGEIVALKKENNRYSP